MTRPLTAHQRRALVVYIRLGSRKEAARVLGMRERTLGRLIARAYHNLDVHNAAQAAFVLWAPCEDRAA